jgi:hypothetical protein
MQQVKPYDLGWLARPSTFLDVGKAKQKMQKFILGEVQALGYSLGACLQ